MKHATYELLDGDIHKLTLHRSSRQAVEETLANFDSITAAADPQETLLILVDMRPAGLPPVNYSIATIKSFFSSKEKLPPIRAAYIHNNSSLVTLVQTVMGSLRLDVSRRTFNNDEAGAIAWLLESDSPD